jgi:hypothetical protein
MKYLILSLIWFLCFFTFTLLTSNIFKSTSQKQVILFDKILNPDYLYTALALIILIVSSPVIEYTNVLDSVLVKSGLIVYPEDSIMLGWLRFPNVLNNIFSYAVFMGLTPEFLSLIITLSGMILWFLAYFIAAKSFGISHITSLVSSLSLVYWNPLLQIFSPVFGFQPPWSGNSTYGMLGLALVAYGMSLCLIGRFWQFFIITVLTLLVSPINGFLLACILLIIGLQALINRDLILIRDVLIWLLVITLIMIWYIIEVNSFRNLYGEIDLASFNTYLLNWDSHRNPERYKLQYALVISIIIISAAGVFFSNFQMVRNVVTPIASKRDVALFAISVSILLPVVFWAIDYVFLIQNINRNQTDVLLIKEMPLRLTSISGFVVVVIAFKLTTIIGRTKKYFCFSKKIFNDYFSPKITLRLSIFAASSFITLSYFIVMIFQPHETLLHILFNPNKGLTSFVAMSEPDELGKKMRQDSNAGSKLTIVAPGLSHQVFWKARLPILLHTENGIDFVGYLPQLADNVKILIEEGYGLDFSNISEPPRCGCIPNHPKIKEVWQNRTVDEWKSFGKKFDVFFVAAPIDWKLKIPSIAHDSSLVLYEIR